MKCNWLNTLRDSTLNIKIGEKWLSRILSIEKLLVWGFHEILHPCIFNAFLKLTLNKSQRYCPLNKSTKIWKSYNAIQTYLIWWPRNSVWCNFKALIMETWSAYSTKQFFKPSNSVPMRRYLTCPALSARAKTSSEGACETSKRFRCWLNYTFINWDFGIVKNYQ